MKQRQATRDFIAALLERTGDDRGFEDSESLVLSGRLDSVSVLEIVNYLECAYNIEFSCRAFDQSLVDSVNDIVALIQSAPEAKAV
jgi:acyl carrier protein